MKTVRIVAWGRKVGKATRGRKGRKPPDSGPIQPVQPIPSGSLPGANCAAVAAGGAHEAHRHCSDRRRRPGPGARRDPLHNPRKGARSGSNRSHHREAQDDSLVAHCWHRGGRRRYRDSCRRLADACVGTSRRSSFAIETTGGGRPQGLGPNTSSTLITLTVPRLSALTPGSIVFRSPTTTTANLPGATYFWATRWTSAAVTA